MDLPAVATLADLAVAAYGGSELSRASGWTSLGPGVGKNQLNFEIPNNILSKSFFDDQNFYNYIFPNPILNLSEKIDLQVIALRGMINGKDSVVIAFRGTAELADFTTDALIPTGILYDALKEISPFIVAVKAFATSVGANLYASGHSLGGALAELLFAQDENAFAGGLGIGSPGFGSDKHGYVSNSNFLHVAFGYDIIGHETLNSAHIGSELVLNDSTISLNPLFVHDAGHYDNRLFSIANSDAFRNVDIPSINQIFIANQDKIFNGEVPIGQYALLGTANADTIDGSGRSDFLRIDGDDGNDHIIGGSAGDVLAGGFGSDAISGGGGDDTLYGGAGNDFLEGGAGNDILNGGSGNDRYSIGVYQGYDTIIDLGDGYDTLALSTSSVFNAFNYNWFSRDGNDLLIKAYDTSGNLAIDVRIKDMGSSSGQIELIELYAGDGTKLTNAWDLSALWAGLSQPPQRVPTPSPAPSPPSGDTINLTAGNDNITSDSASHVFVSTGIGSDHINAPGAYDQLFVDYRSTSQAITSGIYSNAFHVTSGTNSTDATGIEAVTILGGSGNDNLAGVGGSDYLSGGAGDDTLTAGDDSALLGGDGNDSIDTTGSVWVDGGPGIDTQWCRCA